jgi:murein endopeptidase
MPSGSVALLFAFGLGHWLADDPAVAPASALAPLLDVEAQGADDSGLPADVVAARYAVGAFTRRPSPPPVAATFEDAIASLPETVRPPRRVWVRHRLRPRERLSQVAARYGSSLQDLVSDNHLDPNYLDPNRALAKKHRRVRVLARQIPPPRREVVTVVAAGESWGDIAERMRVEELDLRAWNWQRRKLDEGRELVLWVDPVAKGTLRPGQGPAVPDSFEVPATGRSVGRPQHGRLEGGVLVPKSTLYSRRKPTGGLWGSSHTIEQIQRAFANFRHDSGFAGEVVIGAVSRRHGGRFNPHISHQSGRDIDIRLPLREGLSSTEGPNPDEIDWYATWALVKAFIDTGEVSAIFLDVSLHRRLYEAARIMGETPESLEEIITWPSWRGKNPVVKHSAGHDTHIHVRIDCALTEPRCRRSNGKRRRASVAADGRGADDDVVDPAP